MKKLWLGLSILLLMASSGFSYDLESGEKLNYEILVLKMEGYSDLNVANADLKKLLDDFLDQVGHENVLDIQHQMAPLGSAFTFFVVYKEKVQE